MLNSAETYRMVSEAPFIRRLTLMGKCMEEVEDMLKQYDLKQYDSVKSVEMDTETASSLKEFMLTGSPFWVKELYVTYGEGEGARLIRAVDILVGRTVNAPERWVRKMGRELLTQIQSCISVPA